LLSAIETCKEYKNILLGYHFPIIVFTDNKNNNFNGLKAKASDRVLRACWLLSLEEYGVIFEYLAWNTHKNMDDNTDVLSRLDIDSLKIQEEAQEVWTLLSGSENNSISNIKWTIHTALIIKEHAKVKGLREKGLAQPHYSIQTYWRVWYSLLQRKDLHSSIIETDYKEYYPGTMNIYFIRDRLEKKRLSGIPWHGLVLHKMMNIDCSLSPCQACQMTKKDNKRKKYGVLPPKIAESDTVNLDYGLCGSGGFHLFTIRTPAKTHFVLLCLHSQW
jgi:hypothetical protein